VHRQVVHGGANKYLITQPAPHINANPKPPAPNRECTHHRRGVQQSGSASTACKSYCVRGARAPTLPPNPRHARRLAGCACSGRRAHGERAAWPVPAICPLCRWPARRRARPQATTCQQATTTAPSGRRRRVCMCICGVVPPWVSVCWRWIGLNPTAPHSSEAEALQEPWLSWHSKRAAPNVGLVASRPRPDSERLGCTESVNAAPCREKGYGDAPRLACRRRRGWELGA